VTNDPSWTRVPALVFPQGSLGCAGAGSSGRDTAAKAGGWPRAEGPDTGRLFVLECFEDVGPAHDLDFHRYPRDYEGLYKKLGLPVERYEVFPVSDFRSTGVAPFHHALLVTAGPAG